MIGTIVFLVAIIVVWFVIFKIIKSVFIFKALFRIISVVLLLVLAVLIITGIAVLNDANDFRKNFSNSTNLFLLEDNGTILTGMTLSSQTKESFQNLNQDELSTIENLYSKNLMNNLTKSYYKVIVFNTQSIEDIPDYNISDQNMQLNKSEILMLLKSKDAKSEFVNIESSKNNVPAEQLSASLNADDIKLKSYLFSYALNYYFNPKNIDKLFNELKTGNVNVYKETAMFKAIKFVPKFIISDLIGNLNNSTLIEKSVNTVATSVAP